MDSSITAAGRALRAGDPLGALKRVALRARALVRRGPDMSDLPVTLRPWITERSGSPARNQVARGRTVSAASLIVTYPFGYTTHARAQVLRDRRWPQRARGVHLSIAG